MKNKFPLIIAVVIGIVALLAIRSYVNRMEEETNKKLQGQPVVAAAVDIPAGAEVTRPMIAAKNVPQQFIPSQAIQGSKDAALVLGRHARVTIKAGQPLLWSDLASEAHGGLSSIIPAGEGAYTLAIANGIKPGLIQPSDHIDILASFATPKPNVQLPGNRATWRDASDLVNVVLLQNVTVLAVGDTLGGTRSESAASSDLTLSLTLPEAQLLMFASKQGELGAVLRKEGVADCRPRTELPRVTFEKIEEIIGDLDGKRNYRTVEIQKGSTTETAPVKNDSK